MDSNPSRRRPRSLVALLVALVTLLSMWQPSAAMAVEIAPNLVSLQRITGDVVAHGDDVVIAWQFDAPVDSVTVTLRDALGGRQYLYGGWGSGSSGEVRGTVDTAVWPGGSATLDGVRYSWMTGETYHWVELGADGAVRWASEGLATVPSAGQAIDVAPFDVVSDVDLSVPPMLTGATRASGDVLVAGDTVEIAWEFDRAVDSVTFTLRDSVGMIHPVTWYAWGQGAGPATAGVASMQIDTPAWARGEIAFDELRYSWSGGSMSLASDGSVVSKQPEGLADAVLPAGGLSQLAFMVDSDYEPGATPHLASLARSSADVLRDGDEIVLDWAFDAPVDSMTVVLRDALDGEHYLYPSSWGAADAGQVRAFVDTSEWPAGSVELLRIEYSWALGGTARPSVALDAEGDVIWSSGVEGELPSAAAAISYAPFTVESDVDLSTPPMLSDLTRLSADTLTEGDELQVAWSSDRPVDAVRVSFRDPLGVSHLAEWSIWRAGGAAATEGVARATIDTTRWAGGQAVFDGIEYFWGRSSIRFDAAGAILSKNPPGLADAVLPTGDLAGMSFTVDSDIDLTAVPAMTSASRISGDVIHDGEDAMLGWEFDSPVTWVSFLYLDGLGRQQSVMWSGEPATAGVSSVLFEGSTWAPGDAELVQVRYSGVNDNTVVLARDGSVESAWPTGLDPAPYGPGFAALDFAVETDAVFETVSVPAPEFTDASCEAPAHLLLEDFPHGWWAWSLGGSGGYGGFGESFDGQPWLPVDDATFTVTAMFEDGWGTTGDSQWTHRFADPGSCEPLLEFPSSPIPRIEGDPVVGSTLAAVPGEWEPEPVDLAFQWMRDGLPIPGADEPTYLLTDVDANTSISVEVTGTKEGYATATRSSDDVHVSEAGPAAVRVSGEGRFGVPAAVSAWAWPDGVDVAFVVNASDDASAIAGAALAGAWNGPLLSVKTDAIPAETLAELDRLAPRKIVVLGGADLVAEAVVLALDEYTTGPITRVAGDGPSGLPAAISAFGWPHAIDVAFVVNGADVSAGFAGAALAAASEAPLLEVHEDVIPSETTAELERLQPARIVVLGGPESVGAGVVESLGELTVGSVSRISAAGRFTASAAISAAGWPTGADVVYVVNGSDRLAAGAGAALAGATGGPLLTVKKSSIPAEIAAEVARLDPRRVVVLGDEHAIDGTVVAELQALIG